MKLIPKNVFFISHICMAVVYVNRIGYLKVSESRTLIHNIRIYHECEGRIEKSVPRIAVCHHEACRVMTNGDPEGRIFLSYPHTNNGFFFLFTTVFYIFFLFIYLFQNKLTEVSEYDKMQFHTMTLLDVLGKLAWVR